MSFWEYLTGKTSSPNVESNTVQKKQVDPKKVQQKPVELNREKSNEGLEQTREAEDVSSSAPTDKPVENGTVEKPWYKFWGGKKRKSKKKKAAAKKAKKTKKRRRSSRKNKK